MLHWHSPREDLIGVIALIVYVITCGSLSGGRNGSILDSHTIYFLSFGAFNLQESPLRIRGKSTALVFAAPTAEDHPRACGEKSQSQVPVIGAPGSPPRMRGKARQELLRRSSARITPAHAGRSTRWSRSCRRWWDHPRACREKHGKGGLYMDGQGSPPRMRGKVEQMLVDPVGDGITPAHAGKSRKPHMQACARRDHPRACGEKYLMRDLPVSLDGITPAHAGKS